MTRTGALSRALDAARAVLDGEGVGTRAAVLVIETAEGLRGAIASPFDDQAAVDTSVEILKEAVVVFSDISASLEPNENGGNGR